MVKVVVAVPAASMPEVHPPAVRMIDLTGFAVPPNSKPDGLNRKKSVRPPTTQPAVEVLLSNKVELAFKTESRVSGEMNSPPAKVNLPPSVVA